MNRKNLFILIFCLINFSYSIEKIDINNADLNSMYMPGFCYLVGGFAKIASSGWMHDAAMGPVLERIGDLERKLE